MGNLVKMYTETVPNEPNINGLIYSHGCNLDKNTVGDVIHVEDDHIIADITIDDDKFISDMIEYTKKKICTAYMTYVGYTKNNSVYHIDKISHFSYSATYRYNPSFMAIENDAKEKDKNTEVCSSDTWVVTLINTLLLQYKEVNMCIKHHYSVDPYYADTGFIKRYMSNNAIRIKTAGLENLPLINTYANGGKINLYFDENNILQL